MAPEPRIGTTQSDDRDGRETLQRLDVLLQDFDHLAIWVNTFLR